MRSKAFLPFTFALGALLIGGVAHAAPPDDDEEAWIDPAAPGEDGAPAAPDTDDEPGAEDEPAVAIEPSGPTLPVVTATPQPEPHVYKGSYSYSPNEKFLKPIDGEEPPPGYVASKRNIRGVWRAGIAISAPLYALTVLSSALLSSSLNDDDLLRFGAFPLIGSFIVAGDERVDDLGRGLLVGIGIGQLAGFAMIIGGSVARVPVWRRGTRATSTELSVKAAASGGALELSF